MNILILQGSPRANGNTAWMAEEFRKRRNRELGVVNFGAIQSGLSSILGQGVDVVDSDALSREPYFAYTVRKDLVAL